MNTQSERIISKFGGAAAMARALGHTNPTTVQGWRQSGFIPHKHQQNIFDIAKSMGIDIEPADFLTVRDDAEKETAA